MKKIFLIMTALFVSAMMWAGGVTMAYSSSSTTNMTGNNDAFLVGLSADSWSVVGDKGGNSNFPGLNKAGQIRLYGAANNHNIITVTNLDGENISSIKVTYGTSNYNAKVTVGGAEVAGTGSDAEKTYAINSTSFAITHNNNSNTQVYILSIVITTGGTTPQRTLQSIYIAGTATELEYTEGESFDPAGLKVMGKYDTGDDAEIASGVIWSCEPEVFALGNTSVDVTAQYKDFTSEVFTVNNIVVKEKVVPTGYASIYTSNVELKAGENSSDAVIIYDGIEYNGVKCGTSSKVGACTTTIPAATKTLHFHAIGWKGAAATTLTVNGTEYTITSEDGITGNPPFTLDGEAYEYYYTFDPKGETQITITSDKRFVIFGVNAELQEGTVTAPSFEPTATQFDQEVTVTLSAEEGAEIYYTLDGTSPVDNQGAELYAAPFKLTETTTVKAIASKGGKRSDVAEKTYTLIPVFESLEALVTNLPATETNKTVIVTITDAPIDKFYVSGQYTNGVYTHVGETVVELYQYNVPETWEVGGKVSGTIKAEWLLYKGTPELQKWDGGWEAFTYTAPSGPQVDKTGITVNGRKYGFPVRMVTDVK